MDPVAILSLISDLYSQVENLQTENLTLQRRLEEASKEEASEE